MRLERLFSSAISIIQSTVMNLGRDRGSRGGEMIDYVKGQVAVDRAKFRSVTKDSTKQ